MTEEIEQRVTVVLGGLGVPYEVIAIDPAYADTAEFCAHYGYPEDHSGNTIICASKKEPKQFAACVVAVLASLMVSYTRARAEALGVECKVGIATRAVRVVILSVGLLFAKGASLGDFELLEPAVYVLAGLSTITVFQRIWHVRRALTAPEAL